MNSECKGCIHHYYEIDTNWSVCKHPDYNEEEPDDCPGRYSIEDAKADARYREEDKY